MFPWIQTSSWFHRTVMGEYMKSHLHRLGMGMETQREMRKGKLMGTLMDSPKQRVREKDLQMVTQMDLLRPMDLNSGR